MGPSARGRSRRVCQGRPTPVELRSAHSGAEHRDGGTSSQGQRAACLRLRDVRLVDIGETSSGAHRWQAEVCIGGGLRAPGREVCAAAKHRHPSGWVLKAFGIGATCRVLGLSPTTGYKWLARRGPVALLAQHRGRQRDCSAWSAALMRAVSLYSYVAPHLAAYRRALTLSSRN